MSQSNPLIVGITGGIGSGKTTAANVFEKLGVPIYIADEKARALTAENDQILSYIRKTYGDDVFDGEGNLNRKALGEAVFGNKEKLDELNNVIHPMVAQDFKSWVREQSTPYVLKEAAVLFESGTYTDCDYVILVVASRETRIQRVIKRSALSREDIEGRMHHQWSDEDKMALSDFVIYNDDENDLISQIYDIHEDIKRLANSGS
jgi:dephospho-CoA kinase